MEECGKPIIKKEFNLYIPGWALPKERLPIHVEWVNPKINNIKITLPQKFIVDGVLNAKEHEIIHSNNKTVINIQKLNVPISATRFFAGIKIKTTDLTKDVCETYPVKAELYINETLIHELKDVVKILRPSLNVISETKLIVLDDKSEGNEIKLKATKTGFGDIQIKTQCSFGGKIISYGNEILDELYIEILAKFFELYLKDLEKGWGSNDIEEMDNFTDIHFDNTWLDKMITDLIDRFDENIELIGDYSKNEKEQFEKWLQEYIKKGEIRMVIPILVKNTLVNTILKYIGKNRSESSELAVSEVKVKSRIKSEINKFDIEIKYRDLVENVYESILLPIPVEDKRSNPSEVMIRLNINYQDFTDQSIKNAYNATGG